MGFYNLKYTILSYLIVYNVEPVKCHVCDMVTITERTYLYIWCQACCYCTKTSLQSLLQDNLLA